MLKTTQRRPRSRHSASLLTVLCIALLLPASDLIAEEREQPIAPRALSSAERFSSETVADFLSRGPVAFYERLHRDSPLRRMSKEEALGEIAARTGPAAAASWELQTIVPSLAEKAAAFTVTFPSGIDDTVMIYLEAESSGWKISHLRTLAEPSAHAWISPSVLRAQQTEEAQPGPVSGQGRILLLAMIASGLAAAGALLVRSRPRPALGALSLSVLLMAAAIGWSGRTDDRIREAFHGADKPSDSGEDDRIGRLLPLRNAMAAGEPLPLIREKGGRRLEEVEMLWRAQVNLQNSRSAEVEKTLARFPSSTTIPFVHILRARQAFARFRSADAVLAYERALNMGPGRDAISFEAAQAVAILGFDGEAKKILSRLQRNGTREAGVYYALAEMQTTAEARAEMLREAWRLQRIPRESILQSSALSAAARDESMAQLVGLYSPNEIVDRPAGTAREPMRLPPTSRATLCGELLRIVVGDRELIIPAGSGLAPADVALQGAEEWDREEEQRALGDVPLLIRNSSQATALAQPALRQKISRAVSALAEINRWNEILTLTEGIDGAAENVPAEILLLRGLALVRSEQHRAAQQFLTAVAANPAIVRRREPTVHIILAHLLKEIKQFRKAARVLASAKSDDGAMYIAELIRQMTMQERLEGQMDSLRSANFEIRYTWPLPKASAERIAEILESELARLKPLIPVQAMQRVRVNIITWDDFQLGVTGSSHIVGTFDGEITLPFAEIGGFPTEIVAIMSHELAHAMIAQATRNLAPRWFQEGFAQRAEMVETKENAFQGGDEVLPVTLLETAFSSSGDMEMVGRSYITAYTAIRYIEQTYGTRALWALMRAFGEGAATREAIALVTGESVVAFEENFRKWGASHRAVFQNPTPKVYDRLWGLDVEQQVIENTRWGDEALKNANRPEIGPSSMGGRQ
jgi:hypothetical protein